MVMQYPILFPFGEDGFYIGIPYFNNEGRRKIKQEIVTMREYYAYRIQHRRNGGQTILCGGWLFQKFIVDAYTAIEEERLRFIRKKQSQLRDILGKNKENMEEITPILAGHVWIYLKFYHCYSVADIFLFRWNQGRKLWRRSCYSCWSAETKGASCGLESLLLSV